MTPTVSIVGKSNSGKTTLVCELVKQLCKRGFRVGTLKHSDKSFDVEAGEKDSDRHRQSGAFVAGIVNDKQLGLSKDEAGGTLDGLVRKYFGEVDVVISEGFKKEAHPKLYVLSKDEDETAFDDVTNIVGVVADEEVNSFLPTFRSDNPAPICDFLVKEIIRPESTDDSQTRVFVDNRSFPMKPFAEGVLSGMIWAVIDQFDGTDDVQKIEIILERKKGETGKSS